MKSGLVILIVVTVMLVGSVYSLSTFGRETIVGGVNCTPQGGGKTRCCAVVVDEVVFPDGSYGHTVDNYCTTCDNTNPPSNCTPREKQSVVVNPGRELSNILKGGIQSGSVLEEQTTTNPLEGQRANISILPGGIIQEANTSSNDSSSSSILEMEQSDLMPDIVKKPSRTVDDDGEDQGESQTTEEPSDEPIDQDINDKKSLD